MDVKHEVRLDLKHRIGEVLSTTLFSSKLSSAQHLEYLVYSRTWNWLESDSENTKERSQECNYTFIFCTVLCTFFKKR